MSTALQLGLDQAAVDQALHERRFLPEQVELLNGVFDGHHRAIHAQQLRIRATAEDRGGGQGRVSSWHTLNDTVPVKPGGRTSAS